MKYQIINLTDGRMKIAFFIIMVLFGFALSSLVAFAIAKLAGYDQLIAQLGNPNLANNDMLNLFRLFQMAWHMGLFLVGPALYLFLVEPNPLQRLGMNKTPFRVDYLLILVLMVVAIPGINFTHTLNQSMHLPGWLSGIEKWMQQKEDSANDVTEALLAVKSYKDLAINLVMFGVLPAVGEELFFRGALFAIIKDWSGRKHLTVFITAFLFSAIHLQFYGFLPRFLLGVGFGYLFIFTGSLWAPIFAHFLNNSIAVLAAFFYYQGKSATNPDDFGTVDNLAVNLMSIVVALYLFRLIYKRNVST